MNRFELLVFGVFVFLASLSYWLRSSLFGFDSYAFLNLVCFGFGDHLWGSQVANLFFGLFPCSLVFLKLFMFVCLFFGLLGCWFLVKHFFDERLAWISCFLVVGLSPVVLFSFGEFENELLGYPFVVWGIYFLLTWKGLNKLWSLVCFCFSLLFWKWVYYLTFIQTSFSKVTEMNLFHGLLSLWFLLPFVVAIVFLLKKNKGLCLFGLLGVSLWLWNSKLWVFLLPVLCLSIANAIQLLENNTKTQNHLKYLYMLAFFCLVGWNITYWLQSPNSSDWFLVETAIKESQDRNLSLFCDLGYDYWCVNKMGKETFAYQQLWGDINVPKPFVWLTSQDSNCILLHERKEFAKQKKIYYCN